MIVEEHYGRGTSRDTKRKNKLRKALFDRQEGRCYWCTQPMDLEPLRLTKFGNWKTNPAYASFEHLIPKSMGGDPNMGENIVAAHINCNTKRHKRRWPHDPIYGKSRNHDKRK